MTIPLGNVSGVKRALRYPKFKTEALRILVLCKGYHLQQESVRALNALGHTTFSLDVVDSPEFILEGEKLPAARHTSLFLWEKSFLSQYKDELDDVYYLPLACDPSAFRPRGMEKIECNTFVGDSMTTAQSKSSARIDVTHMGLLNNLSLALENNRQIVPFAFLTQFNVELSMKQAHGKLPPPIAMGF